MPSRYTLGIKWSRLLLAILATVVIADTVPHPQLAPGVLQSIVTQLQAH
ncbi:MAG: hypothetical protein ACFCVD_05110 [Nodosilinea sp.]